MRVFALIITVFLAVTPAFAQEMPEECRLLGAHKPDDNVAYQPGVDVNGNPVTPADLNAAPTTGLVGKITVPLSIDLAERLQNSNVQGLQMEAPLGLLEIHPDGRVVYDGQDWTPQVYAVCEQENPVPAVKPSAPPAATGNGQDAANTIKSETINKPASPAIPEGSVEIQGGEARQEGYK